VSTIHSQSITPFTINIAGFTSNQISTTITVSIGETLSIYNFKSTNGESLNTGFIQNNLPIFFKVIDEPLTKIGENEVTFTITPNPTKSTSILALNSNIPGEFQYQILDVGSNLLFRSQLFNGLMFNETILNFSNNPPGIYYVMIFFKPISGILKKGIYKIVKL
jgi:hypothetical protein